MLRNYFKIAVRNLWTHRATSFINIFGLAVAMACCVLIGLYIRHENGYDRHWQHSGQLYRMANEVFAGDNHVKWPALAAPLALALRNEFPEVEATARLLAPPNVDQTTFRVVDGGEVQPPLFETKGYLADSSFFQIFTYPFLHGNPARALSEPNSVVLSETVARKLFGTLNPLGKVLRIGNLYGETDHRVTGVFRAEGPSHLDAHFFTDMRSGGFGQWVSQQTNWSNNTVFYTYLTLRKSADPKALEAKLPAFMDRNGGADMKAAGLRLKLFLQALSDIHLHSGIEG